MKALIYRKFGDPSVLEWVENWPPPVVSPNSVLIRSIAGGVNPKDVLLRKGKFSRTLARDPLPRVVGLDVAGEVVEVGKDVSNLAVGDLVFGMTNRFSGGIHSELATLDANEVACAPSDISVVEASSIPLAAQTALQALRDHCKVVAGQRVLINGASGGVGHFAVQIAKTLGAEVHAVCGPSHVDFVTSLGADVVHDHMVEPAPTIASSFHSVFDVFGRFSRRNFAEQLGTRGIFVSTVPKPATLGGEFLAHIGLNKRSRLVQVKSSSTDLSQIREWVETNQLRPHVDEVYPAARADEAHRHIEGRHTTGKIVLRF
ncbi:MAG: NAD(P)-dependent alcohol dehydrogenase [Thermoanaerobaculales bacterium]|nr:NAD(P)-dependent alcohol dehydrogenase [Thermoanaerobaculales bacterium]